MRTMLDPVREHLKAHRAWIRGNVVDVLQIAEGTSQTLRRSLCILGAVLLFAVPGKAQPLAVDEPDRSSLLSREIPSPAIPSGPWSREKITVKSCKGMSPKIDGSLDDPCWKTATHARGFYRISGTAPVVEQTEAWVCADNSRLYVAFHCLESRPDLIQTNQTQRNGSLENEDRVRVDIDSQNTGQSFSRFEVSARGTQTESIEGGTPDNITWTGDWKAATRRVADGWTIEIAIPFALLRYPRNANSFGILLYRRLGRETLPEVWPYLPPGAEQARAQYFNEFIGIDLPHYAPRPVILPYVLTSAGEGASVRQGLDVKYPLSTTMTALATVNPDFQTIEQDVTDINFTYTEKYLSDRRPFFAEGTDFLPGSDLFYSRRVQYVDDGLKVVGKTGRSTLGILGTSANSATNGIQDIVVSARQDTGPMSHVGIDFVGDTMRNKSSNRVAKLSSQFGWQEGQDRYYVTASNAPSWQADQKKGNETNASIGLNGRAGHPGIQFAWNDVDPDFTSNLGFVPETDLRGYDMNVDQFNEFSRGPIEAYYCDVHYSDYNHHSGSFYRREFSNLIMAKNRRGVEVRFGSSFSGREQFRDHIWSTGLSWGLRTLLQRGGVSGDFGEQAGQSYRFLSLWQGIYASRSFNLGASLNQLNLGSDQSTQTVVTGTYLLSASRSIGGRLVQNKGGTNFYLSFGQKVRSGTDVFIVFGDPNSPKVSHVMRMKLIRPL